jgi:hypothetical protein
MDFVYDQLDSTECAKCGGLVDVAGRTAFRLIPCPHCQADVRVPGKLGSLLLKEVVGTGSAGIVYRAIDSALNRPVAVKILKNEDGEDTKKIVEATVAEARALAAINHPNVVHVHTIGMRHGQPYIVMELLIGSGKLNVMLKEGWVADEQRGLEIGIDVAQGLRAAQAAGLLHRDVKPGNILFNIEGVAKLLDFSVVHAKAQEGEKVVIGTPYYISPEAARGQEVDFRTDIYSLGATLYHLLTGQPVFDGESSRDVLRARLKQAAPDIRDLKPHITDRTAAVINRMLAMDATDRHESYDELIAELRDALEAFKSAAAAGESIGLENSDLADLHSALEAPAVPVATPRRHRLPGDAKPVKSGLSPGIIGGLIAAGIAVAVAIVWAVAGGSGGSGEGNGGSTKDGAIASNADGGRAVVPRKDGDRDKSAFTPPDEPKDAGDEKDKSTPAPPNPPVIPQPPVVPVDPPQPPREDPFITALKAWELETAALLKREATTWKTLTLTKAQSQNGATLATQADGSVLVSGASPATDTFVLEAKPEVKPEQITGLRLEALPDASLPAGGPGRSAGGNFVLSQVSAALATPSDPRGGRGLNLHLPAAEYAQESHPIAAALDADAQTGWAISPRTAQATAALFLVRDITAPTPVRSRDPIVFDNFENGPTKFSDKWTAPAGNAFKDRPFKDGEIVLPGLAGFQGQHMAGSVLGTGLGAASADLKQRGTGTLASKPFKIERGTIAFLLAGGDKETTRIQLKVDGKVVHKSSGDRSLKLKRMLWDVRPFEGKEATIEVIDEEEKDNRGYILVDQIEFTDEPAGGAAAQAEEPVLRITLAFATRHERHALGRFRLSITTSAAPFLDPKLPENIKTIVLNPRNRTAAQAKELETFYRRTKVDGLPYLPPGVTAIAPPRAEAAPSPAPNAAATGQAAPKLDAYAETDLSKLKDAKSYDASPDATVLVPRQAKWVCWASADAPAANWAAADFVAGGWSIDEAPMGFGYDNVRTPLKEMKGRFTALYARAPFTIADPARLGEITLHGRFDDAIAVYLNGQPVYRSATLTGSGATAKVTQALPRSSSVTLELKDAKKHLKAGVNVIAIECHNSSADDLDFILDPALVAARPPAPRAALTNNRKEGWGAADAKLFSDDGGLIVEGAGNDPRIETSDIKTDFDDRSYAVKVIIKLHTETAGAVRLDWRTKPKNLPNAVADSESQTIAAAPRGREVVFKVKVTGKLQFMSLHLPRGTTTIESIRVVQDKDGKALDTWGFAKE